MHSPPPPPPPLLWEFRRTALHAAAWQQRVALPCLDDPKRVQWAEADPGRGPRAEGVEGELARTLRSLQEVDRALGLKLSEPPPSSRAAAVSATTTESTRISDSEGSEAEPSVDTIDRAEMQKRMATVRATLVAYNPSRLAIVARGLHAQALALHRRLEQALKAPDACMTEDSEGRSCPKAQAMLHLSREQKEAVECHRSIFVQGRSGTGKTLMLVQRMLRHSRIAGVAGSRRQMFVTKSSLLLNDVISQLQHAGCQVSTAEHTNEGIRCFTWSQLVTRLGGQQAVINYDRFVHSYWPALQKRVYQLPAHLVWTEFNTKLRPFQIASAASSLPLQTYTQNLVSAIGVPLHLRDKEMLYSLFIEYSRMKQRAGEVDDVDVASKVLGAGGMHGSEVDNIYIDEAQDFSPWELIVLLKLCTDPDGVSVAGDTCQTISIGSAFNFEDIREAFILSGGWRRQGRQSSDLDLLARAQQCSILHLHCNYRCAPGVAAFANSVVRLLLDRFPGSADWVEEETVQSDMCEPPFFIELLGLPAGDLIMGAGAQRATIVDPARAAVLVRTDAARQALRAQGVRGTILTVAESKGLEFDFVILCDMLTDCSAFYKAQLWRLADGKSKETRLVVKAAAALADLQAGSHAAMDKLRAKHTQQILLSRLIWAVHEFKSLYVASTRARRGCAFLETKNPPSAWSPLLQHWVGNGVVTHWSGMDKYLDSFPLEQDDTSQGKPPLVAMMCSRFGDGCPVEASIGTAGRDLQVRGEQLLRHAGDEPRERWPVFEEARNSFLAALAASELASFGINERSPELVAVLCEVCRRPQWRGGSKSWRLSRLPLWARIYSFLLPADVKDVYNEVALAAECMAVHVKSRSELKQKAVRARAWYLLSRARYDPEASGKESVVRAEIDSALLKARQAGAKSAMWHEKVSDGIVTLHALCSSRAELCSESGRAFSALKEPLLAAEAFKEAAATIQTASAPLQAHTSKGLMAHAQAIIKSAGALARASEHSAARSFLLAASQPSAAARARTENLRHASACFARAAKPEQAAILAVAVGSHLEALRRLVVAPPGNRRRSLVLLIAAALGNTPSAQLALEYEAWCARFRARRWQVRLDHAMAWSRLRSRQWPYGASPCVLCGEPTCEVRHAVLDCLGLEKQRCKWQGSLLNQGLAPSLELLLADPPPAKAAAAANYGFAFEIFGALEQRLQPSGEASGEKLAA